MRWAITLALLPAALAAETHQIIPATYFRTFSHTNPVLKRIQPGDVVATQTVDSSGRDFKGEVRHPESGNPLTGPFFIEGAEPGDAIVVQLRKMRLNRNWGYSAFRLGLFSIEPEAIESLYKNEFKPGSVIPGRGSVLRWDLDPGTEATVRDLAGRESGCCSFFVFTFRPGDRVLRLDVEVPAAHVEVLDALASRAAAGIRP